MTRGTNCACLWLVQVALVTASRERDIGYLPYAISGKHLMRLYNSAMYSWVRETIHNLLPSPSKTRCPEPGLRVVCELVLCAGMAMVIHHLLLKKRRSVPALCVDILTRDRFTLSSLSLYFC